MAAAICDNLDNDCDGVTDNDPPGGPKLCPDPTKPICFQGNCVGDCSKGEFPCPGGTDCDTATGYCVQTGCAGISCPAGQTCKAGACIDPCGPDTKCPYGQSCELGNCIDPCKGVTCPTGRVCEKGLCLADCACRGCDTGLSCGADGRCTEPACASVMCAAGLICQMGNCVDPCVGVTCPLGQSCSMGTCTVDSSGTAGTSGGIAGVINTGTAGVLGNTGGNRSVGGASGSGASAGTSGKLKPANKAPGCACRAARGNAQDLPDPANLGWLAALVGLGLIARKRASRSAPRGELALASERTGGMFPGP